MTEGECGEIGEGGFACDKCRRLTTVNIKIEHVMKRSETTAPTCENDGVTVTAYNAVLVKVKEKPTAEIRARWVIQS